MAKVRRAPPLLIACRPCPLGWRVVYSMMFDWPDEVHHHTVSLRLIRLPEPTSQSCQPLLPVSIQKAVNQFRLQAIDLARPLFMSMTTILPRVSCLARVNVLTLLKIGLYCSPPTSQVPTCLPRTCRHGFVCPEEDSLCMPHRLLELATSKQI
ncbi:hypothetical protein BD310DRAFT_922657 [Dichomitus squalens]|uniref:Uncharacterized protein n=1 Tax=Dichomitus squalens TaxID=114155 RepID=A0A4Q9Q0I3_9APHY|nr:hypothetical protein BD310DRAFT_922657 [Dichomitus squalens]